MTKTFAEINRLAEGYKESNPDAGIAQAYRQGYIDAIRDKEPTQVTDEMLLFAETPEIPTFEEFWTIYDYKKEKRNTEIFWERLTVNDKLAIMAKVRDYVDSTKKTDDRRDPRKPRMYPATYINPKNRRWEDEIDIVPTYNTQNNGQQQQFAFAEQSLNGLSSLVEDRQRNLRKS